MLGIFGIDLVKLYIVGTRPMRPATEMGSRDSVDANMELRIEAARRLDFECSPCPTPTPIQIVHAVGCRPTLQRHIPLILVTSCPIQPSPCPTTPAPATGI